MGHFSFETKFKFGNDEEQNIKGEKISEFKWHPHNFNL